MCTLHGEDNRQNALSRHQYACVADGLKWQESRAGYLGPDCVGWCRTGSCRHTLDQRDEQYPLRGRRRSDSTGRLSRALTRGRRDTGCEAEHRPDRELAGASGEAGVLGHFRGWEDSPAFGAEQALQLLLRPDQRVCLPPDTVYYQLEALNLDTNKADDSACSRRVVESMSVLPGFRERLTGSLGVEWEALLQGLNEGGSFHLLQSACAVAHEIHPHVLILLKTSGDITFSIDGCQSWKKARWDGDVVDLLGLCVERCALLVTDFNGEGHVCLLPPVEIADLAVRSPDRKSVV